MFNRQVVFAVACLAVHVGCSGSGGESEFASVVMQNVGLVQTSGTPPLGEGVAPLDGAGGDGSPAVPGKGFAEGGPGAVRWYGGQWLIPYAGRPGSTIQNVSCDVIPNASSTDLIEIVGAAGVIGSVTVPAVTGVVIRAWITTPHVIAAGEPIVIRHNPRDVATGAWTSGVQQLTIVGCAVNTTRVHTVTIPIVASLSSPSLSANLLSITGSGFGATHIAIPLSLAVGQTIYAVRVRAADSIGLTSGGAVSHFAESLLRQDDSNENFTTLATATPSLGNNTEQTISISPLSTQIAAGSQYWVALQNASGTGQSLVYRLEIDVQ